MRTLLRETPKNDSAASRSLQLAGLRPDWDSSRTASAPAANVSKATPHESLPSALDFVQSFQKLGGGARLGEQRERRECQGLFDEIAFGVAGVNDHRNASPMFFDFLECGGAVEVRHCEVQKNQIRRLVAHPFQGFPTAGGSMNIVAVPLQHGR